MDSNELHARAVALAAKQGRTIEALSQDEYRELLEAARTPTAAEVVERTREIARRHQPYGQLSSDTVKASAIVAMRELESELSDTRPATAGEVVMVRANIVHERATAIAASRGQRIDDLDAAAYVELCEEADADLGGIYPKGVVHREAA